MAKEPTSPRKEAQAAANSGRKSGEETARTTSRAPTESTRPVTPTSGAGSTPTGSGESSASGSSTPPQNDGNSGQKPVTVNQAVPQPEKEPQKSDDKEISIDELRNKPANELTIDEIDTLIREAKDPEEKEKYEKIKQEREIPGDGKAPEAGKIEKTDDPDEPKDDDDKFDIQQGDFIEFLMKDVVLAAAAWGGKKVSGQVGLWTYRGLSWAYHKVDDKLYTPAKKELAEAWDNLKKNTKEAFRTVEQYQVKDTLTGDNSTVQFTHEVLKEHNKVIDDALKSPKRIEAFGRFAATVVNGKLKEGTYNQNGHAVWFDKETRTTIPLEGKTMQDLIKMVQETSQAIDASDRPVGEKTALKDLAAKDFSVIVGTYTLLESQKNIFMSNMATATLLQMKAENKDYQYSKEELEAMKNRAAITFFTELRKIRNGQSQFKTVEEFLEASGKAVQTAYNNVEKGRYDEKGKMPPANAELVLLNNLNTSQRQENPQDMLAEAMQFSETMRKLQERHNNVIAQEEAARNARTGRGREDRRTNGDRGNNGGRETGGDRGTGGGRRNSGGRD